MTLPSNTFRRLPAYLHYLKRLPQSQTNVSATTIAVALELGEVQVRKDLSSVSGAGRPRTGYDRLELIRTLEGALGYSQIKKAVIIGAGKLGEALMCYGGFFDYGLDIIAAFDIKPDTKSVNGKPVYKLDEFTKFCKEENVKIGIITVPAEYAQETCDLMCEGGIKGIWNFAPIHLNVPSGILVQEENMASSLAILSNQLQSVLNK